MGARVDGAVATDKLTGELWAIQCKFDAPHLRRFVGATVVNRCEAPHDRAFDLRPWAQGERTHT